MTRSNQILIGLIVLLIGVSALVPRFIHIPYGAAATIAAGCAFLLMYRTKRKTWALAIGTVLLIIGCQSLLGNWFTIHGQFTAALFFLAPGIIFLVLFLDKNIKGLLIPASLLIWFAAFLMGRLIIPLSVPLFFACLGFAFITIYALGKGFLGRWPLFLGLGLGAIAVMRLFAIVPHWSSIARLPGFLSFICILIGVVIILRAVCKKK